MKFLDSNGLTYFWQRVKSTIEEEIAAIPSDSGLPAGSIVIWSGAAAGVPSGWAICDGTNGTPDLRGRFVLGGAAGSSKAHPNMPPYYALCYIMKL